VKNAFRIVEMILIVPQAPQIAANMSIFIAGDQTPIVFYFTFRLAISLCVFPKE
jgi:hypothetical protein